MESDHQVIKLNAKDFMVFDMEILKNFGFEPVLFFAQIVNFLAVLFLLRRFLYKPVLTMLKQRKDTIDEGLAKAEEAQKLFEKAKKEEKDVLNEVQIQARQILTEAKNEAIAINKKAQESAKTRTEAMITEAKDQMQREAQEVQAQIMRSVSSLAVDFLRKALLGLMSETGQTELMKKAIKQIEKKPN